MIEGLSDEHYLKFLQLAPKIRKQVSRMCENERSRIFNCLKLPKYLLNVSTWSADANTENFSVSNF